MQALHNHVVALKERAISILLPCGGKTRNPGYCQRITAVWRKASTYLSHHAKTCSSPRHKSGISVIH